MFIYENLIGWQCRDISEGNLRGNFWANAFSTQLALGLKYLQSLFLEDETKVKQPFENKSPLSFLMITSGIGFFT